MARLARVILPGYPHHITQRGSRRQDVFFKEEDYYLYLELLKQWCAQEQRRYCSAIYRKRNRVLRLIEIIK